jgi:hypothetical protein
MINFIKLLVLKLRRMNSPTITEPLTWSKVDFERAKKWAQSRLYPGEKYRTVWEVVYSPRHDSVEILNEINHLILIENNKITNKTKK